MDTILVLYPVTEAHKLQLQQAAPDAEFCFRPEEATDDFLSRVTVVLGRPTQEQLEKMPKLEHVQLNTAGVEPYSKILPASIGLTNASGAYGEGIAEHSLGMVLMLMKKLHRYRDNQRRSSWTDLGMVGTLIGAKVLVVGLGDLGKCFARRMHALGCHVTGIKRTPGTAPEYVEKLYTMEKLDECLQDADVVYLSLPNTPATDGLFCAERIAKMKPGSILINVGRGNAVDLNAVCDALESGHLSGAGVDVTEPEPLPSDHRAWLTENMLITPHVSGGFHMELTHDRIVSICAENLRRRGSGQPLTNVVNRKENY